MAWGLRENNCLGFIIIPYESRGITSIIYTITSLFMYLSDLYLCMHDC